MTNVLVVAASFRGGGAERLAVEFANTASKLGYNVTYFIGDSEGPYKSELDTSVKLIEGKGGAFSKSIFKLSKLLRQENIECIFCSQEYVVSIAFLAKFFSRSKAFLIGREASTPSINWSDTTSIKVKVLKRVTQIVYQHIDKLIVPTESVKSDLQSFYNVSRYINVIPNPVDTNLLEENASLPVSFKFNKNIKYLIVVGRLIKSKGVDTIIKAIHLLSGSDYHLIILGDGPYYNELLMLSQNLDVKERVHFLGFQSNPFPYIKNADLFISASQYEGMPNSLIQAIALNKLCISTLSTSVVTSLLPENNIFPYDDERELANCITSVLTPYTNCHAHNVTFLQPSCYVNKVLAQ